VHEAGYIPVDLRKSPKKETCIMSRLWCWGLIALLLMLTNVARAASFDDAIAAYKRKDYPTALSLFDRWQKRVTRGRKAISVSCTPTAKVCRRIMPKP